ncbi:MAG: hypothetical protein NQU42_01645 [Methanothrix sp.]|nr:hypothetical protein [Methanothrix sp.]MCQ8902790.1 hypothetical protein [Methanothrix sp.]
MVRIYTPEDFLMRFFSGGVLEFSSCLRHHGTEAHEDLDEWRYVNG